eukprot:TRINITY_DN4845_c0_g1_i3.p1 TRINITY_DN4845_c0_g1~~TRINITY_DN4845_c0_g1_i3.p1  ORF type:complete len:337 (+),score=74.41 TRINITY_DN4845_c0_g1_i3:96-1013(+)
MNCFQESHNFAPSFFEDIVKSLDQESKMEVDKHKILYWLATALGLLYLLNMSIPKVKDPAKHGISSLSSSTTGAGSCSFEASSKDDNLMVLATSAQNLALVLCKRVISLLCKEIEEDGIVFVFLGRPREKVEVKKIFIKTPVETTNNNNNMMTTTMSDILSKIEAHLSLLVLDAKIFDKVAKDMLLSEIKQIDEILYNILIEQKQMYATYAPHISARIEEVTTWLRDSAHISFTEPVMPLVSEFVALISVEYSKLNSEEYIRTTFPHLKASQILQVLEVLKPDSMTMKPIPTGVLKTLKHMISIS